MILDEGVPLTVGRAALSRSLVLAVRPALEVPTPRLGIRGGVRGSVTGRGLRTLVSDQVAVPDSIADLETHRRGLTVEGDQVERELVGRDFPCGGLRNRGSEPRMVERGLARPFDGVDDDELTGSRSQVVAVPEAPVVVEPVGYDLVLEDKPRRPSFAAPAPLLRRSPRFAQRGLWTGARVA